MEIFAKVSIHDLGELFWKALTSKLKPTVLDVRSSRALAKPPRRAETRCVPFVFLTFRVALVHDS